MSVAPTLLAPNGDTAVVSLYVTESDGSPVSDGTHVALTATGGTLCAVPIPLPWFVRKDTPVPTCAGQLAEAWPTIVDLQTSGGVAKALVRSGASGTLSLSARSGGATKTVSATVSGLVAPSGAKLTLQADPDKIAVDQTSTITAFLIESDGTVPPDGTLVVFSTPDNALSRAIVATQVGFARTVLMGKKAGDAVVTVMSGAANAKITVTITQ